MSKLFNKADLIQNVVEKSGCTKAEATECVGRVMEGIVDTVKQLEVGDKFVLVNYLAFEKEHVAERKGRHPKTRETIVIPERDKIKVKLGKHLKEAIN